MLVASYFETERITRQHKIYLNIQNLTNDSCRDLDIYDHCKCFLYELTFTYGIII